MVKVPHKCMNCGKIYDDDSEELVEGCECGASVFIFEKGIGDDSEELEDDVLQEVDELINSIKKGEEGEEVKNLVLDPETIEIEEEGVYSINLKKLLKNEPLILEVRDNRYFLHLASMFNKEGKLSTKDLENAEKG